MAMLAGPAPTNEPASVQEDPVAEQNRLLERFGLLPTQIEASSGQEASERFQTILNCIEDEGLELSQRIALSHALLKWHRNAADRFKNAALDRAYFKIIEICRFILIDPDGANLSLTAQQVARNLALLVHRQTQEERSFRRLVYKDLLKALQFVVDRQIVLEERAGGEDAASLRCESLRLLLRSLPTEVDDAEELKALVWLLMTVSAAAPRAPLLRQFIAEQISSLRIDDDDVVTAHVDSLLDLVKSGHHEAFATLRRCRKFFNARSQQLVDRLDDLLDAVGFEELQGVVEELGALDPGKLVKSVAKLVQELGRVLWEHKLLILGVLLVVAAVAAAPFLPCVASLGAACLGDPRLYAALFRLLAEVGSHGDDLALGCLQVLAKVAKAGLLTDPALQSSLLEAVNVLKDSCKYCNIFHPDTLKALERCASANPAAFHNVAQWNKGKSARVGDKKRFLQLAAGAGGATSTPNTPSSSASTSRWWTPMRTKHVVSPSPQSQNLAAAQAVPAPAPTPTRAAPAVLAAQAHEKTKVQPANLPPSPAPAAPLQQLLHSDSPAPSLRVEAKALFPSPSPADLPAKDVAEAPEPRGECAGGEVSPGEEKGTTQVEAPEAAAGRDEPKEDGQPAPEPTAQPVEPTVHEVAVTKPSMMTWLRSPASHKQTKVGPAAQLQDPKEDHEDRLREGETADEPVTDEPETAQ